MRYCIYGNPTIDIILESDKSAYLSHGGGSYYSTLPLIAHGIKPEVYAVYSHMLHDHPISNFIIKQQYSTRANIFILEYKGLYRDLRVLDISENILDWNTHAGICNVIANPVMNEIGINLLRKIRLGAEILAVDIQGFIRNNVNSRIKLVFKPGVHSLFEIADIIHTDIEEFNTILRTAGITTLEKMSRNLRGIVIVTSPPNNAVLITRHKVKHLEFEDNYVASQKTGAGDYYLGAYTYYYSIIMDEEESAYKAHNDTSKWLRLRDKGLIAPPPLSYLASMASLKTISGPTSVA